MVRLDRRLAGMEGPAYACALLRDARQRWLLELRPQSARIAGGLLTCFGGRREAGETVHACLVRELTEELGWVPPAFRPAVELWDGTTHVASFWWGQLPLPLPRWRSEPGVTPILAPTPTLPGLPVSPWHRRVLAAALAGEARVDLTAAAAGPD